MLSNSFKQMFLGAAPAAKTVKYTVPAEAVSAVVKDLTAYNSSTSAVTFKMYINDIMFVNTSVAAGDTIFGDREWTMVLNAGDKIALEASTADVIQVIVSGAVVTNATV